MKVLLVHNHLASFIETDIDLLKSAHDVKVFCFQHRPPELAKTLPATWNAVVRSDVIVSWFGGFHAFVVGYIAKMVRKPHVIIASGYDVANIEEIGYGNMRPGMRRYIGRRAFQKASKILPVSKFAAGELRRNVGDFGDKVEIVQHGFAAGPDASSDKVSNRVVMIAGLDRGTQILKGVHVLIECARRTPEISYFLIGGSSDDSVERLRAEAPPNLTLTGFVKNANKSEWMRQAAVYAQLSRYESFGCGLAEAMLQSCIPVVTDNAALPEVAGDAGFYTRYGDVDATIHAIRHALVAPPGYGLRARERILTEFPLEKRRKKLLAAIDAIRPAKSTWT